MKIAASLILLVLAAPGALADGFHIQEGPIVVDASLNDVPGCAVPVAGVPCPAGYDTNGTLTPTDDSLYAYRALESASITVSEPLLPDEDVDFDLTNLTLHHHALVVANDAALALVALLPPLVQGRTTVYSHDTGTVISIMGPGLDGDAQYNVPIFFFGTDRNGTTLPNGVLTDGIDSDAWVPAEVFEPARLCTLPQLGDESSPTCDALPAGALGQAWPALSPRVVFGLAANNTSFHTRNTQLTSAVQSVRPTWLRGAAAGTGPGRQGEEEPRSSGLRGAAAWTAPGSATPRAVELGAPAAEEWQALQDGVVRPGPWLLAVAGGALLVPALWVLYQRITGARVLQHPQRQRIRDHLRDHPGCDVAALAAATGLSFKTAAHHVGVLRRGHIVRVDRMGRRMCVSLVGDEERGRIAMATRHPVRLELLRIVQAKPGLRQSDIARALGVQRSTLHRHVHRLLSAGMLVEERRRLFAPGGESAVPAGGPAMQECEPA